MKLIKFAFVGGIGFIVDTSIFTLCLYLLEWPLMSSRVIAFFCAATSTWLGNRYLTFSDTSQQGSKRKQWLKFMTSACISAIPNFITFKLSLEFLGSEGIWAYVALVLGILIGMISNYLLSDKWVFKAKP